MSGGNWLGRRVAALEDIAEGDVSELFPSRDAVSKMWKQVLGPYIDGLKDEHRELLEAVFFERLTHAEYAEQRKVVRSNVTHGIDRAMRALLLAIAKDDPEFANRPRGEGRPRRDPAAEEAAAWRVLQGRMKEALRG